MTELEKKIQTYHKMGWHPVKYAHHPKPIKDALRKIGMRPQMKQCFANCQRFISSVTWLDLDYHEGYVSTIIPTAHAWLTWEGQRIDLTLNYGPDEITYHGSEVYDRMDVICSIIQTGMYQVLDERAMEQHSPWIALVVANG